MKNTIHLILIAYFCSFTLSWTTNQEHAGRFKITIERMVTTDDCIMGYFFLEGTPICYSLEIPYRSNVTHMSSIPKGKYNATIRTDGSLGWRIELVDVPNRENVQIHIGNYPRHTTGCTLIGIEADVDTCGVLQSGVAMNKLSAAFKKFAADLWLNSNSTNRYDIQVEYK